MMTMLGRSQRTLRGIERGLAGSDPRLAGLFAMFTQLTRGDQLPGPEKLPAGPGLLVARLRPATGPNRPPQLWRTWIWTILLLAGLTALPYAVTTGAAGHCAPRACTQSAQQHPRGDQRHAARQATYCRVRQDFRFTPASCPS